MEHITEEENKQDERKALTAEEQNVIFHSQLRRHCESFEKIVNSLPSTQAAILFCGALEKLAGDFKEIFLDVWAKELAEKKLSNGAIKRARLMIQSDAVNIMSAKHTQAN